MAICLPFHVQMHVHARCQCCQKVPSNGFILIHTIILIVTQKLSPNLNMFVHRNSHTRAFGRGVVANRHRLRRTLMGSRQMAPTIDGLTMQQGRFSAAPRITCSARAFVNVYVLGRGWMSFGVITSTRSSSIHLRE